MESNLTISELKALLEERGYYVQNLWCVEDVTSKYKCSDEEAQNILNDALTNEYMMSEIWEAIDMAAEGYEEVEE